MRRKKNNENTKSIIIKPKLKGDAKLHKNQINYSKTY